MDGGPSRCIHQKVAPAHPTAVMKLSAPRARAPPNATPKSLRAPEPCSVKANTSPVTMTATDENVRHGAAETRENHQERPVPWHRRTNRRRPGFPDEDG